MIDYPVVLKHLRGMLRRAQAGLAHARSLGWSRDAQRPLVADCQALTVAITTVKEVAHA